MMMAKVVSRCSIGALGCFAGARPKGRRESIPGACVLTVLCVTPECRCSPQHVDEVRALAKPTQPPASSPLSTRTCQSTVVCPVEGAVRRHRRLEQLKIAPWTRGIHPSRGLYDSLVCRSRSGALLSIASQASASTTTPARVLFCPSFDPRVVLSAYAVCILPLSLAPPRRAAPVCSRTTPAGHTPLCFEPPSAPCPSLRPALSHSS